MLRSFFFGLFIGLLASLTAAKSFAQDVPAPPTTGEVRAVEFVDVDPSGGPVALTALQKYKADSLGEPGAWCLQLFGEQARPGRMMIVETWLDQAAYDAHVTGKAAHTLAVGLQSAELSVGDIRVHRTMIVSKAADLAALGQTRLDSSAVVVMTHLDVPPPFFAALQGPLNAYVEASSKQPGSLSFEVLQHVPPRQNHLTILEAWTSEPAYEADRIGEASRHFRDTTVPILGALYDERLYHLIK